MQYGYGYGFGKGGSSGVSYDALAATYFAAVPNSFDAARKTIINTLIAGLRSDGNLTKLDRLWLFANTTTGNAVIDVIGLNSATLVNAPAFVADQGYTGDGATSYINSGYNPATNGVNLTLNSVTLAVYTRTDATTLGQNFSCNDGASFLYLRTQDDLFVAAMNDGTAETAATANTNGLYVSRRTASNATAIFQNGSSIGTSAVASTSIPSYVMYIGAMNSAGSPANYSVDQISVVLAGSGTIDQAALYTRIQQYMTDLGTQV